MTTGLEWIVDASTIDDPEGRGERAVRALRKLRHPKSTLAGNGFQLDPWAERIVRRIYGPITGHGTRLTSSAMLSIASLTRGSIRPPRSWWPRPSSPYGWSRHRVAQIAHHGDAEVPDVVAVGRTARERLNGCHDGAGDRLRTR